MSGEYVCSFILAHHGFWFYGPRREHAYPLTRDPELQTAGPKSVMAPTIPHGARFFFADLRFRSIRAFGELARPVAPALFLPDSLVGERYFVRGIFIYPGSAFS